MKRFYIIGVLTFSAVALSGCNIQEKQEKISKAEKDAAYIMANLDKPEVLTHFPAESFSGKSMEMVKAMVSEVGPKCDWSNRNGKFVDFCSISNNGNSSIAYIYEYFLKCDSLRFVMLYDLEPKEPRLVNFQVEPLEKPNPMIIYPEKQLLNQKKQ
ncbi:hypothetical protein [Hymenobacter sp. IS2118]|uniref:hypothetical protein n=1 Tax=Hymenobacter sp. IS2118 TaxID=1505605 RepID=UPI0005582247|nr:hypothetical protein [Hymenobacter sp. IS2118]